MMRRIMCLAFAAPLSAILATFAAAPAAPLAAQCDDCVFTFGDIEELSYLASVRKSLLAMLYGHWVDHLVTARSGVYHPASNSGDNPADAPPRGSCRSTVAVSVPIASLRPRRWSTHDQR